MMVPVRQSGETEVWKYIATAALSVVLTMVAFFVKEAVNGKAVTRDELQTSIAELKADLPAIIHENNPYTLDQKSVADHLVNIDSSLRDLRNSSNQQASDIAGIAYSLKIPAKPIQTPIPRQ